MTRASNVAQTEHEFIDALLSVVGGRVSRGDIARGTRLVDDLAMTSIELLQLILACEREIGASPADNDDLAETLSTVGAAVDALHQLRNAPAVAVSGAI